ncbi:MAG TPA: hypothetical protein VNU22_08670 [Candidatus Acidoferrum sp.]|jgi:hypothetical protein|nr:hypothetical protein [Candidatus Acidoferrum sp.]
MSFSGYALKIGTAAALLAGCVPIANSGLEAPVATDAIAKTLRHFGAGPTRPDRVRRGCRPTQNA